MDPSYGEIHLGTWWEPKLSEAREGAFGENLGNLQCPEAPDGGARLFPAGSGSK